MNEKKMLSEDFEECILTMLDKYEHFDKLVTNKKEKLRWLSTYKEIVESRIFLDFKKWLKESILSIKNDEIDKTEKELDKLKHNVKTIENMNISDSLW